jgi:hypothetical protein
MINLFEKKLQDYLTVYKTPIGPNDLDPTLFVYDPTTSAPLLSPRIIEQITKDLQAFSGEQPSRIKNAYIIGKTVLPGNIDRHSPLKVVIVMNKDIMDADVDGVLAEEILKMTKSLSGRLATGTTHPINYTVSMRDIDTERYQGIYDIQNGRWLKIPSGAQHGKGSLS